MNNKTSRYTVKSPIIQITHESSYPSLSDKPSIVTTMTTTYDEKTNEVSSALADATNDNNKEESAKICNKNEPSNGKNEQVSSSVNLNEDAGMNNNNNKAQQQQKNSENGMNSKNETITVLATISSSSGGDGVVEQTHAYKKRFFILALFCAHSAINSFQWIQYSSITNVIASYYGATNLQVNLTSLVYMITYIPFIIQASLMLERVGLRKAILLGTLGTALGSAIKWLMGGQAGMVAFWWMMLGQTIVALSQLYIISIPPLLAAVWFPDYQVSTATGIGVFGNQLGIALGFIIPPWVISDVSANKSIIGADLNALACAVFWLSFLICLVSFLTLEDKPPKPPGSASLHAAQHQQQQPSTQSHNLPQSECTAADNSLTSLTTSNNNNNNNNTKDSIKVLCRDEDLRYLIISYGINVGVFYAVSTVLNQMVATRWPELVDLAGRMGLLIVVSGMAGSVICGQLLDRTHAYKLIIVLIYLFSLVSMLLFTLVLKLFSLVWPLYLASITLGFFMTGYLPLGFEFAAEITYPHSANTPAGLLNLSAQIFGLILTYASSLIVDELGDFWANTFLTVCLAVGLVLTVVMKADLKRQKAIAEEDAIQH